MYAFCHTASWKHAGIITFLATSLQFSISRPLLLSLSSSSARKQRGFIQGILGYQHCQDGPLLLLLLLLQEGLELACHQGVSQRKLFYSYLTGGQRNILLLISLSLRKSYLHEQQLLIGATYVSGALLGVLILIFIALDKMRILLHFIDRDMEP